MDEAARENLAVSVLGVCDADAAETIVFDGDERLTRFTQNAIHQNVASSDVVVRIRAVVDGRCGVAETNDLRKESLERTAAHATRLARIAPADPEMAPLARMARVPSANGAFDAATAEAPAAARAQIARQVFAAAEREGLWAAGFVTTSRTGITVANSQGTLQSFDGSDAGINVKQNGPDSSGFAERFSVRVGDLDGTACGERAARKAVLSKEPVAVDPGEWTVILEPPAFAELVAYLAEHFSAQAYDEGSSFFSGKLGERFAGNNVTLVDDVRHSLNPGMPFDFEGSPTQRVTLLERGAAAGIVTDARWAAKLGRENTGHALPEPNASGPLARHLVVEPGSVSSDDLVAATKRGLLITRLWYVRTVDQRRTIVTGMTRDGAFLVENGKIVRGVHNMRFNQSIVEALGECTFSRELARSASYAYSIVVPSVRFDRFTFSSATDF